jgi:hypothetical protein
MSAAVATLAAEGAKSSSGIEPVPGGEAPPPLTGRADQISTAAAREAAVTSVATTGHGTRRGDLTSFPRERLAARGVSGCEADERPASELASGGWRVRSGHVAASGEVTGTGEATGTGAVVADRRLEESDSARSCPS